ncbi:uncharacterized protein TM35_000017320 [Trypanosoma theileri]|uniref:START domain-containing protein n=1 Tax=Trypanosoma theileri TaxID=67003 RepID=A0A1X0PAK7_9TRYP|nr:uncharacterized protein TM35_000017320 [Trypanosoma theileri]ORC93855.1 hypothetical protein TM35_000017320 [Trypanosoma theileri]
MPWVILRKGVAVSATVATAAAVSWLYRQDPAVLSQETPTLTLSDIPTSSGQLWDCMRFLDERQQEWNVESNNFPKGSVTKRSCEEPKIQVLRLGSPYPVNSENGRPAPFMRVVGFLPDVLPEEVFECMTDLQRRKEWDHNYHMFRKWDDSTETKVLNCLNTVERPIEMVAKKNPICQNNCCVLIPDIRRSVIDYGWFAHRVGHKLLEQFGIADRLFVYERSSVCYTPLNVDTTNTSLKMYDVLYSGTDEAVNESNDQSEKFAEWLNLCEKEHDATRVSVNYQHILILPIADAASQLWSNPMPLSFGGSMVDKKSTKLVYDAFMNSVRLHKETKRLDGTLMIMTSANDVQIPSSVPMWAQRMMASFFSNHAYREMLKAIRSHRKQIQ